MKNMNIYKTLKLVVGSLLGVVVLVTILYGTHRLSYLKKNDDSNNKISNKENVNKITKIEKVDDICSGLEVCEESKELKFSRNKMASFKIFRDRTNKISRLSINDVNIDIEESSELEEVGVLKSKYFVVSYRTNKKNFYYLDEDLREVKRVLNVEESAKLDMDEYKYFTCMESDSARGGIVKNNYTMKITDNGTFMSSIDNREEGFCS